MLHTYCEKLKGLSSEKKELFDLLASYEEAYHNWFRISPILLEWSKKDSANIPIEQELVKKRESTEYAFKKCLEHFQRSHG